jgi:hypothetical protein
MIGLSVKYKIFYKDGDTKVAFSAGSAPCFATLQCYYNKLKSSGYVKFYVHKICSLEEAQWYTYGLNNIGLNCSMVDGIKWYKFTVYKAETYPKMLAILTAIRYLQEYRYPEMVKWGYKKSQENPELRFFDIFKLMHFAIPSVQEGHGFIGGWSVYGNIYKLANLDTFIRRLEKAKSVNQMLVPDRRSTLSREEKKKIKNYFNNGKFGSALEELEFKKEVVEI